MDIDLLGITESGWMIRWPDEHLHWSEGDEGGKRTLRLAQASKPLSVGDLAEIPTAVV